MTETTGLGRIKKADLRDAWPNEAADFTPWLADHVSVLGAALGLELELESEEAPVGTFSLDLLARDTKYFNPVPRRTARHSPFFGPRPDLVGRAATVNGRPSPALLANVRPF